MVIPRVESEWAALTVHESSPSKVAHRIEACARVGPSGAATFRYVLRAEVAQLRIPSPGCAERAQGLWKHTCFEAFVRTSNAPIYHEFNFSPSRQWAVYRFQAYREGASSPPLGAPPEIVVRRFANRLEVDAAVGIDDLIDLRAVRSLQVALSAVVEEENGTLSYWALKHAAGKADFHSSDGYVLELVL